MNHHTIAHLTLSAATRLAILALAAAGLLAGLGASAAPEEGLPTGKEVMERAIKAAGGREAFAKLNNRVVKAKLELKPMGLTGTATTYQARPCKAHSAIDIEGVGTILRGYDGDTMWEIHPMFGTRVVDGEEKAVMFVLSQFDESNYEALYETIECVGTEDVDGTACYKVLATPKGGKPMTVYYAKESGLPLKSVFSLQTPAGEFPTETRPSEFKEVDGITIPHRVEETVAGTEIHTVTESIQHNVEMPDDRFDLPEEIKNLLERTKEEEAKPQATPLDAEARKKIEGHWRGVLNVGPAQYTLVFRFTSTPEGALTGAIDSVDQGVNNIPISEITFKDGQLDLDVKGVRGSFEGKLNEETSTIEGQWSQPAGTFPLVLKRDTAATKTQ